MLLLGSHELSSKQEQRERYQQVQCGRRTLLWLLGGSRYHKLDLMMHPEFVRVFVHCIAAEKDTNMEYLWSWLSIDEHPAFAVSWRPSEQKAWRASVLKHLMESTTYWAPNVTQGLEEALVLYEHGFQLGRSPERQGNRPPIPFYPAGYWLHRQLSRHESHDVSQEMILTFASSLHVWCTDHDERSYLRARLLLQIKPFDMFKYFKKSEEKRKTSLWTQDFLRPKARNSAASLFISIVNTSQALEKARASTQARWILDFGRALLPEFFQRRPLATFATKRSNDGLLRRVRASPDQIAQGVPVDKDGFPVLSERQQQLHTMLGRVDDEEQRHNALLQKDTRRQD